MVKKNKVNIFFISILALIILLYIFIANSTLLKDKFVSALYELPIIKNIIHTEKDIAVKQQRKHKII